MIYLSQKEYKLITEGEESYILWFQNA